MAIPKDTKKYARYAMHCLNMMTIAPQGAGRCKWSENAEPATRSEAQNGNTIAAENYYQHAEHYFRSMSSTSEDS